MRKISVNPELVKRVEDKIVETYLVAQSRFGQNFDLCNLSFDKYRSKKKAGCAEYSKNLVWINPAFLEQFPERILSRTVPHEIAHLITHKLYPRAKQHHGPEWRSVMRKLEITDNSRCHDMRLTK